MSVYAELSVAFAGALPQGTHAPSSCEREQQLNEYVSAAHSAWPLLQVSAVDFVRHTAVRSIEGTLPPLEYAGDLLLACACLHGVPQAIAAFHANYDSVIGRVLCHRGTGPADAADLTQMVYERLLVRRARAEPKLASYRGQGALRSWVATTTAAAASTLRRAESRRRVRENGEAGVGAVMTAISPELSYLKRLYGKEIERAIEHALGILDARASLLLRLHFGEGLSIDQLGAMYGVNRATAARWLAGARETMASVVRGDLRRRLKLTESDCESLVALLRSELGVTVIKLFDRPGSVGATIRPGGREDSSPKG